MFELANNAPIRINLINTGDSKEILQGIFKYYIKQLKSNKGEIIPIDIFIYSNIDFLFEQKFPIITLDKDEIRGGIFGLKTDKILLSFIINLAIRYNFSNDEEVLACLFNNNYLPIGSLANNCHKYLYHDAGYPKMWSLYNYNEIKEIIDNNKIDFNIPKIVFHNNDLQE